jgi:nicotinamide-nucleotide amidase
MWFSKNAKAIISLPGVPYEMKHLIENQVIPRIKERYSLPTILHRTLMVAGIVESSIAEALHDVEERMPKALKLAYLPKPGLVRLRLTAKGDDSKQLTQWIDEFSAEIYSILGIHIYGENEQTLAAAIGEKLVSSHQTLAIAESCTGGYLSHIITSNAGSSAYYNGSFVSYSNEMKIDLLDVRSEDIEQFGVVSEIVTTQLAENVTTKCASDWGIGISGIAGPSGGSDEKPVGMVCMSVFGPNVSESYTFNFGDRRDLIIERAAMHALWLLWKALH